MCTHCKTNGSWTGQKNILERKCSCLIKVSMERTAIFPYPKTEFQHSTRTALKWNSPQ